MSIFTKITEKYGWKMVGEPVRLSGGFMHKIYKINTQQGTFVLKLLNPFVMQRETSMDNFAKAERFIVKVKRMLWRKDCCNFRGER